MRLNIHLQYPKSEKINFLKQRRLLGLTFGILFFLTSCDHKVVYQQTLPFENENWEYDRLLKFDFSIADTVQTYDIVLTLDHSGQYRYQNVYTNIRTTFPNGENVDQVVSLQLSDGKGRWLGNCRGNSCTIELNLQKGIKFPLIGQYSIGLEQHSRDSTLEGILSVALSIFYAD